MTLQCPMCLCWCVFLSVLRAVFHNRTAISANPLLARPARHHTDLQSLQIFSALYNFTWTCSGRFLEKLSLAVQVMIYLQLSLERSFNKAQRNCTALYVEDYASLCIIMNAETEQHKVVKGLDQQSPQAHGRSSGRH